MVMTMMMVFTRQLAMRLIHRKTTNTMAMPIRMSVRSDILYLVMLTLQKACYSFNILINSFGISVSNSIF